MPNRLNTRRHFLLAILGTGAAMLAGCGQGTYDERMGSISQVLAKRGAGEGDKLLAKDFYTVSGMSNLGSGTRKVLKFKLPAAFMVDFARDLPAQDPAAKFPHVELEGNAFTRQTELADAEGKKRFAYCYFHSFNKAMTPRAGLEDKIKQSLSQIQASASWQPAGKPSLAQGSIMTINASFDFGGENLPGQLVIYLFETDDRIVLIGWRSENKSAQKANLASAIGKSMDSIVVEAEPPPMVPGQQPPVPVPAPQPGK